MVGKNLKSWLDCLPIAEFAYNRAAHSATKLSPFEVAYGFNPTIPSDLVPLPPNSYVDIDANAKAEKVRKLHVQVKERLEKQAAIIKAREDKKRKAMIFEPGDWVWLHMRPERFPSKRKSKLAPRGDGPFKVLARINYNAYKLELPGESNISASFNVADLAPYHADTDEDIPRTEPSQEGGNDVVIVPSLETNAPMTRSKTRKLKERLGEVLTTVLKNSQDQEVDQASPTSRSKVDLRRGRNISDGASWKLFDQETQERDLEETEEIIENQESSWMKLEEANQPWPLLRTSQATMVLTWLQ